MLPQRHISHSLTIRIHQIVQTRCMACHRWSIGRFLAKNGRVVKMPAVLFQQSAPSAYTAIEHSKG